MWFTSAAAGRIAPMLLFALLVAPWVGYARPHPVPNFEVTAQHQIIPRRAPVEVVFSEGEFTEGPVAMPDGTILFSDIGDRIYRFNQRSKSISVFREPSGKANGLIYDARGRLLACEGAGPGGNRRVSITDILGKVTTLADRFEGKRFNSPNDLTISTTGNVYFTDPRYVGDEPRELDFEGVFVIDPSGKVRLATRDVEKPNGIVISLGDKAVYVSDNSPDPQGVHQLVAFRVLPDGTLGDKRVLFDFGAGHRGIDGMTIDTQGNVYAAAGSGDEAGIYVFSPTGATLAFINTPGDPTNCDFGVGPEASRLYMTGSAPYMRGAAAKKHSLYRVPCLIPGYHLYPKAK
jgi:gluconolactonase